MMKSTVLLICLAAAVGLLATAESKSEEQGKDTVSQKPNASDKFISKEAGEVRDDNGLKLKLVWCPPGEFTMGTPPTQPRSGPYEDPVQVRLTNGFWLGRYEVTQGEWQTLMGTTPWKGQDHVQEGTDYPATYVSYDDARTFCKKLTEQERQAGRLPDVYEYTLPTEAQWEYGCRAGTTTRFSFGDDAALLSDYAWWGGMTDDGNARNEQYPHRVGLKEANPWGLFDMHGNAWEWCRDWFVEKLTGGDDPLPAFKGSRRAQRGGGWRARQWCWSAGRVGNHPGSRIDLIGFRIALSPVAASSDAAKPESIEINLGQQQQIATIEALGATVFRDIDQPGHPVVAITLNRSAKLKDDDLQLLTYFSNVRELGLGSTAITDAGLKHLGMLKNLTILNLVGTKITDAGLAELAGLQNLEEIRLGNTAITDAGLKELAKLKNLEVVGLRGTQTTEAGLKELRAALPKLGR